MANAQQSSSAASRKKAFAEYVVELMVASGIGPVTAKGMFGGHGVYLHGLMFGLLADEVLYLKGDDASEPAFAARGLNPFRYQMHDKVGTLRYYEAPAEVYDEPEHMRQWARLGYDCALRAQAAKQKKTKPKSTGGAAGTAAGKAAGGVAAKAAKPGAKAVGTVTSFVEYGAQNAAQNAASPGALSDLRNLGPKTIEMLAKAGIKTSAQLRKMGSVQAYARVKAKDAKASLNLLWSLEGALTDRDWKAVAETDRATLLMTLEDVQRHLMP